MKEYDNYKLETPMLQVRQKTERIKTPMIDNVNQHLSQLLCIVELIHPVAMYGLVIELKVVLKRCKATVVIGYYLLTTTHKVACRIAASLTKQCLDVSHSSRFRSCLLQQFFIFFFRQLTVHNLAISVSGYRRELKFLSCWGG
ncbi:hypothetical protein PsorP6_008430 [Peronosclerospora sorghi]|uniref:Uncharacterized protein n=1 Tax=Peronosclerospora sorghi TaxID=230839 RepID=A0ACC0W929_9STRA|nr:hypothetical protein PsorP6_008430 [Peronosclerospora sorghi]